MMVFVFAGILLIIPCNFIIIIVIITLTNINHNSYTRTGRRLHVINSLYSYFPSTFLDGELWYDFFFSFLTYFFSFFFFHSSLYLLLLLKVWPWFIFLYILSFKTIIERSILAYVKVFNICFFFNANF